VANRRLAGLRLDRWMERLRARTDEGDPPEVIYSVQPTMIVSDQTELGPAFPGPRGIFGSNFFPSVGNNAAGAIIAGSAGCWGMVDLQMTNAASATIAARIVDAAVVLTGVFALGIPLAPAVTNLVPDNSDPALPLKSRFIIGSVTPAQVALAGFTASEVFGYFVRDAAVAANAQFHIGGGQVNTPRLWIAPGRALVWFMRAANTFVYYSGYAREPAMEPSP
jgi:hypothetical protein